LTLLGLKGAPDEIVSELGPSKDNLHDDLSRTYNEEQRNCQNSRELIFSSNADHSQTSEVSSPPSILHHQGSQDDTQCGGSKASIVHVDLVGGQKSQLLASHCQLKKDPKQLIDRDYSNGDEERQDGVG